jgi:abortive infection bacteriophage resistance protein
MDGYFLCAVAASPAKANRMTESTGASPSRASLVPYDKPWLSTADQVARLAQRGLSVNDIPAAEAFLSHVNYYRFSGYCLAFEDQRHQFRNGTRFEDVREAYFFDVKLRDIVLEALEVIEIDFRTTVAHAFSRSHGAYGHTDASVFYPRFNHAEWLEAIRQEASRSRELFVTHFRGKYQDFPDLPIWIATEVMSYGSLSRMYDGMKKEDQKAAAINYQVHKPRVLSSVMHHFVYVRNICAHHARLWDKFWSIKPIAPQGHMWQSPSVPDANRLFLTLLLIYHLLKRCSSLGDYPQTWKERLHPLLQSPPSTTDPYAVMGMPPRWDQHPVWR